MAKQIYGNLSGRSGVHAYEVGWDWIAVTFRDNSTYPVYLRLGGESNVVFMRRWQSMASA